jgi:hypothetical protein
MTKELSRRSEREGTGKLVIGGSAFAAVLFVGLLGWFAVPTLFDTTDYLGRPSTGADKRTAATTVGTGLPTQREAESAVGKNDPAGNEDQTGGRARNIKESSRPVSLSGQQRDKLRTIFSSSEDRVKVEKADFEMMVGTSVPRQAQLADLPPEATQVLNGYWGDQYLIAGKDLVVVDQHSRRVAAIISGVN